MIVIPKWERLVMVDGMTALTGTLNGVICQLYKNDMLPSSDSVLADFDICDFPGYADSAAIVWTPAFINALEQAVTTSDKVLTFRPTDDTMPQVAFGYVICDAGKANLKFAERFDQPVPLNDHNAAVHLVPTFAFGG